MKENMSQDEAAVSNGGKVGDVEKSLAPETAQAQQSPFPAPPPPSSKKPWVIIGVIIAVIVVIIAVMAYLLLQGEGTKDNDDKNLAAATQFDSPSALVDSVERELKGQPVEVSDSDGVGAVDEQGFGVYSAPSYSTAGKQFANLPEKIDGVGYVGSSVIAEENYATLKSYFTKNKFREIRASQGNEGSVSANHKAVYLNYAEFESQSIVCAIRHVDASATNLKAHISSIGCADKTSYAAAAEKLQVFYDAYIDGHTDVKEGLVFGLTDMTSGADGYEGVITYQEDKSQFVGDEDTQSFYGLYYKTPSESTWKFFTGLLTNETFACSEFNSNDVKKAFAGVTCYDEQAKKELTVS